MPEILYEDASMIIVKKPAGMDAQSGHGFGADMVSMLQNYLADQARKKGIPVNGAPYVAVVHRLDKPVSGVMVYAKTRQAAADLSKQMQESTIKKVYYALICGKPADTNGILVDNLIQDRKENRSRIAKSGDPAINQSKIARLGYTVILQSEPEAEKVLKTLQWEAEMAAPCRDAQGNHLEKTLVRIELFTGRHHQIRVQMAGHGTPLWGDARYQPEGMQAGKKLALCAWELEVKHPKTGRVIKRCYADPCSQ